MDKVPEVCRYAPLIEYRQLAKTCYKKIKEIPTMKEFLNKKLSTRELAEGAIFAAAYIVLVFTLSTISYGAVQCRIADFMMMFCYKKKQNVIGYAIGGVLANMFSPIGPIDMVVGLIVCFIPGLIIYKVGAKIISAVAATVINGVFIALELYLVFAIPYLYALVTVSAGVAVTAVSSMVIYKAISSNAAARKRLNMA